MNIGSFNVRGISSSIKKNNLVQDLTQYKLDLISIQETKTKADDQVINGHRLITFEHTNRQGGLGFLIAKTLTPSIESYWCINERLAVLKLKPSTNSLNSNRSTLIINTHLPTSVTTAIDSDERDNIYNEIQKLFREYQRETILIAGDFNSKVGKKIDGENCLGNFSKGVRNDNGQRLVDFCIENKLFITNSSFKHPSRHITTWEGSFRNKENKIVKVYNQIDFVITSEHHKKHLLNARTYSGTNVTSDHRLVVIKFRPKQNTDRKFRSKRRFEPTTDFTSLQDTNIKSTFTNQLNTKLCSTGVDHEQNPIIQYEHFIHTIKTTRNEILPKQMPGRKSPYCPILQRLSEKQKQIRLNISSCQDEKTKQKWKAERNKIMHEIKTQSLKNHRKKIDDMATEIETAPDSIKMYKAVKTIKQKRKDTLIITDDDGKVMSDDKQIAKRVKSFFEQKYKGEKEIEPFEQDEPELETPITDLEVNEAIHQLRNNRAPGLDGVKSEEIQCLADTHRKTLAKMFNEMFKQKQHLDIGSGKLILLNKPNKKKGPLENLRPIVLLSAIRKVLSIITLNRIRPHIEQYLSPSQSGFRRHRSTGDIVWAHRWLKARTQKYKEEFSILGIDMSSAFDTICRTKLITTLNSFLDKDHIRLIRTLLANTTLTFTSGQECATIRTTLGTPQGDSLSPILFTVYLETALRDLRHKLPTTARLTRELIYADDADLVFDSEEEARLHIPIISDTLRKWNLKVNEAKTEITTVDRNQEEWKSIRKLGNLINENEDIQRRKILT